LERGDVLYGYVKLALATGGRGYPCEAGVGELAVAADGGIYPCPYFAGEEMFRVGDVAHGVDRDALGAFRAAGMVERKTDCAACPARHACAGGCLRDAIAATGRTDAPNPARCDITRHLVALGAGIAVDLEKTYGALAPLCLEPADLGLYENLCRELVHEQ
jgi:radical SAM protein with 4Fe4S-binding SPASM domain